MPNLDENNQEGQENYCVKIRGLAL
jgi:hypothetical protein